MPSRPTDRSVQVMLSERNADVHMLRHGLTGLGLASDELPASRPRLLQPRRAASHDRLLQPTGEQSVQPAAQGVRVGP
jgi:hypothetical protein